MLRRLNPKYDNEFVIGRVVKAKAIPSGGIALFIRENYDDYREEIKPTFLYVGAFEDAWKTSTQLKNLEKSLSTGLVGVVIAMGLKCKETEDGKVLRKINWFKVVSLPKKKEKTQE